MSEPDSESLVELVVRTVRTVRRGLPTHVDPDDLLSDGLLGLLQAIRGFDPSRGVPIAGYATLRIRGSVLDGLRRRKRAQRAHIALRETELLCQDARRQHWETRHDARVELDRLCRRQRVGLVLHYLEGLSLRDTGAVLGMSEAGAGMLLLRAVRKLRELRESKKQPRGRRGPRGRHFSPHTTPDHR